MMSSPSQSCEPNQTTMTGDGVREVRPNRLQSFKTIMDRMSPDKEDAPSTPILSPDKVLVYHHRVLNFYY